MFYPTNVVLLSVIDKRELKCGGDSNVPLGFVSLTEHLMMVGMAVVMAIVALT